MPFDRHLPLRFRFQQAGDLIERRFRFVLDAIRVGVEVDAVDSRPPELFEVFRESLFDATLPVTAGANFVTLPGSVPQPAGPLRIAVIPPHAGHLLAVGREDHDGRAVSPAGFALGECENASLNAAIDEAGTGFVAAGDGCALLADVKLAVARIVSSTDIGKRRLRQLPAGRAEVE